MPNLQIDGNGVMLNGYNRNTTISGNEFAWVGATCVASWGYSSTCFNKNCSLQLPWREGPDARGGEQPRGTRVLNNLFRVRISSLRVATLEHYGACLLWTPLLSMPSSRTTCQPRMKLLFHMIVQRTLAQEMGIYQKQASAYFHAKSGLSEIAGNVVFNGPLSQLALHD